MRAAGIGWDQATRVEALDFISWLQVTGKPAQPAGGTGGVNSVTGKPVPRDKYAPATVAHCETVLRSFYEFHLEAGTGPMVNPFPLVRDRGHGRPLAHHNPMQPWHAERSGRYRPRVAQRIPRQIPDEKFDELFAVLGSHRDRALVSLWVSSGARASEPDERGERTLSDPLGCIHGGRFAGRVSCLGPGGHRQRGLCAETAVAADRSAKAADDSAEAAKGSLAIEAARRLEERRPRLGGRI